MSVARHLRIELQEYDRRIRTFIPGYQALLEATASTVALIRREKPLIVDLGVGTGALAARCLVRRPRARLHGIDADPDILAIARRRLRRARPTELTLRHGDFTRAPLPRCHALVATLALHHIRSAAAKRRFYRRCAIALEPGGVLATGDCFLADEPALSRGYMETWRRHLRRSYTRSQTRRYLAAWAREDTYFSLSREWDMVAAAGLQVDVLWRQPPFAVLLGRKRARR